MRIEHDMKHLAAFYSEAGSEGVARADKLINALDEHAIVSIADTTGKIIYVNDLFCQTSGYSAFELVGAQHNIVKSGEHPEGFYEALWETISAGRTWHGEMKNRRKDGGFYWVASTIVPVLDDHGLPARYVSIRTDISAEKRLDEQLQRQRAFLANIAEAVGDGILVEDMRGACVFANQAAARLLGCMVEDLLGRHLHSQIVDSLGPVDFASSGFGQTGAPELTWFAGRYEGSFIGLDGRRLSVAVNVQPMSDGDDSAGTVITFHDNTDDRAQRSAMREAGRAAEQANRAKSAFLANMSHEIRTPLNGVIGLARLALDERADGAHRREYLENLVDSAEALGRLISDVLDLAKIEAGKVELECRDFDLRALLTSVLRAFRELASDKGLALHLQVAPDLPARVSGDPIRVRQILTNYLSNALKFTRQGRVDVAAEFAATGQLRLSVTDTGIGVEPDVLSRLFTPFTQADESITRKFGGSGLGLSICRDLAQLMGGCAGARSVLGQGSTFWVELPLPASSVQAPEVRDTSALTATGEADLRGLRVLLVEDNLVNSMIADAMMRRWGVEVLMAGDGSVALDVVEREQGRIDVVLMDLHMPVMSGHEATEVLRKRYPPEVLPIVAFTAATLGQERERSEALGMAAFLTKPFDPERLRAILAECTGRASTVLR